MLTCCTPFPIQSKSDSKETTFGGFFAETFATPFGKKNLGDYFGTKKEFHISVAGALSWTLAEYCRQNTVVVNPLLSL